MAIIKNIPATYALSLAALVFLIFISVFGVSLTVPAIIMYMLLFAGLFLGDKFHTGGESSEPTSHQFQGIGLLAVFGLMTWLILSLFLPQVWFTAVNQLQIQTFLGTLIPPLTLTGIYSPTWMASFVFVVFVVPPAEEQFFRVLIGNLAAKYSDDNPLFFAITVPMVGAVPAVTMGVIGGVFASFHLSAYGLNYPTLAVLWGAGSIMYYIDLRAGNPLPSILSHAGNNALAMAIQGNILAPYFPTITPIVILPLMLAFPMITLGIMAFRGRVRNW